MQLGIHLTLLIGPTVAVPAPVPVLEALQSVEVSHSDSERSGFQLTFEAGRSGPAGLVDYPLLSLPLLRPMSEVAGRMSVQVGAHYPEKEPGGRGVLLGGVPGVDPAKVVVLGGGVFLNELLTAGLEKRLRDDGVTVHRPRLAPPGDGGLALGQAVIAAHRLAAGADGN